MRRRKQLDDKTDMTVIVLLLGLVAACSAQGSSGHGAGVIVVGAGMAGITCARELVKLGFKNVTVLEARNRIGGRLWSVPLKSFPGFKIDLVRCHARSVAFFELW